MIEVITGVSLLLMGLFTPKKDEVSFNSYTLQQTICIVIGFTLIAIGLDWRLQ